MIRKLIILGALCAVSLAAPAQSRVLKWAHVYEPTESFHLQAVQAATQIARDTQDRVRVEVIPASRAGGEETFLAKLKSGEIDIAYLGMSQAAKEYPGLGVAGFPFVFQDTDHVRRYLGSPFFQEQLDGYEKATGNHIATAVYYGARHVTSNRLLTGPQDMAGLRLRVPAAPANKLFGEAMKAQAVTIPFAKVYDALKSGEVDGQENPLPTIHAKKFYEVQKFTFLTAHIYELTSIMVSPAAWKAISPADQKVVDAAIKKAGSWVNVQIISSELTMEAELRKLGMRVLGVDRKAFRDFALKNASPGDLGVSTRDYDRLQALASSAGVSSASAPPAAEPVTERKKKPAVRTSPVPRT